MRIDLQAAAVFQAMIGARWFTLPAGEPFHGTYWYWDGKLGWWTAEETEWNLRWADFNPYDLSDDPLPYFEVSDPRPPALVAKHPLPPVRKGEKRG